MIQKGRDDTRTCLRIEASVVQFARKQLQSDDGINNDDENDQQCNV